MEGDGMDPKGEVEAKVSPQELLGCRRGGLKEADIRDRKCRGKEEEDALLLLRPREEEVLPPPHHPGCPLVPLPQKWIRWKLVILNRYDVKPTAPGPMEKGLKLGPGPQTSSVE